MWRVSPLTRKHAAAVVAATGIAKDTYSITQKLKTHPPLSFSKQVFFTAKRVEKGHY